MQVFIRSFGCSANMADGEVLAGCISEAGIKLTTSEIEADVLIYNTCAVKGPTENRVIDVMRHAPKGKKLIVTGCLPMIDFDRLIREIPFDGAIGPAAGRKIVGVVSSVAKGERVVEVQYLNALPSLDLPKVKSNPVISIVPISYGCLGSCTYCCVVYARGHLRSYGMDAIVDRVKSDFAMGASEFWVTSQDTACYGRDLNSNLAELLKALDSIACNFKVRVGMMTPNMVTDIQDELVAAFRSGKVFKFLHLPVQSGDDETLKRMRRFYTAADFKKIIDAFRGEFPDLTIATDIIVGFPGETTEAFQNTLKLLEEAKPDVINVSKFFARPKTEAANIRDGLVEQEEIKRRSALAATLAKQLTLGQNERWVGWAGEVLVDEKGKVEGSWVGRNFAYKPIAVKSDENLMGKVVNVKVIESFATYLRGEIAK